ncbi:hypothetical protein ALO91_100805 [Pseudomonas syringae pv. aceris]|uniref:Uncharacterized protein n=1 Tax=Pseudomonas syringae pv. aceris TaxID=199198 RepID=A0A0P9J5I5_PSESX|nr:hypothetical protein ALO91_100805 [Pseudomonas syringae pv. aceris]
MAVAEGLTMPAGDHAAAGNRNTRSILTWASGAYYARRRLVRHPDIAPGGLGSRAQGNRSASFRRLPCWSLADRLGWPSNCQSMASSASSQAMQRSAEGV